MSSTKCKGSNRIVSPIVIRNNTVVCPVCQSEVQVHPNQAPNMMGYRMVTDTHTDTRLSNNPWISN
jgi:uncharacterized Zn finger protein (UPF0148 family)